MLVLLVTTLSGLITGLPAWWIVRRSRTIDIAAPHVRPATVTHEVERHAHVASWLERRRDPSVVTGSLLTAAVAAIVAALGGVGIVLAMIRTNRGFANFDVSAARLGADHATALSTRVLRFITQFGGAVVLVPLTVVLGLLEVRRQKTKAVAAFLAVVVGGQFLVANLVKELVARARPDFSRLTGYSGTSFPSGHATAAAAAFAAGALVAGRGRSRRVKAVLTGGAVGGATAVAATRVLLGVHWLTDAMAGLLLGWGWFALGSIAFGGRLLRFGAPVYAAEEAATAVAHHDAASSEAAPR